MDIRTAQDVDKGVIKRNPLGRIPFVPDGPDAVLYKRLMSLLAYVDGRVSMRVSDGLCVGARPA